MENRDRSDSRNERKEQGRKRNMNESEETEEMKTSPLYPYLLQGLQALPNCKPVSVGRPGDVRYKTPSHHPPPDHPQTKLEVCTCALPRMCMEFAFFVVVVVIVVTDCT